METKINYIVVGLFALLLSAALIMGVLWLSAGKQYNKPYDLYVAYINESVSGLNVNAPVKYRGVEVGQVKSITLDKSNPEQVRLEFAIEQGTPIKIDTIATLKSQGLTGIAYIDLSGGTNTSPILEPKNAPPYPVIKVGPSLLGRLDTGLSGIISNLNKATENINNLLDEENRKALKQTLSGMATLANTLTAHKAELDRSAANAALTMENAAQFSAQLPALIVKIGRTTEIIDKLAQDTAYVSTSVRKSLDDTAPNVTRFVNEGLPELERMMVSIRELTASLQLVTEQIERNPGVLLRGKEERQHGPGE